MARCWLFVIAVALVQQPRMVQAFHGHLVFSHGNISPWMIHPGMGHSGHWHNGYHRVSNYRVGYPIALAAYSSQPIQSPSYNGPNFFPLPMIPDRQDPAKSPVTPSSATARMRSLQHQIRGDQKMRQQKWSDARAAYRSSVDAAPDRAEAHVRLGLCLVAIQQYEPAIRQFKRAIFIDPKLPKTLKFAPSIFGADSKIVQVAVLRRLSDWVREDHRDSDRLFLFGVMLHFEGDDRASEILDAAIRMKKQGDVSHITPFIDQDVKPAPGMLNLPENEIPNLNEVPIPLDLKLPALAGPGKKAPAAKRDGSIPAAPLRGAPVPMPEF